MATKMTKDQWASTSDVKCNKGEVNYVRLQEHDGPTQWVWDRYLDYVDHGPGVAAIPKDKSTLTNYAPLPSFFDKDTLSVTSNALQNAINLQTVVLPQSCSYIGNNAFQGCTMLRSFNAPGLKNIGDYAFSGCTSLLNMNLWSTETIGKYAFQNCPFFKIALPESVQSIGDYAFYGSSLGSVTFNGPVGTISSTAFTNTTIGTVTSGTTSATTGSIYLYSGGPTNLYYELTATVSRAGPSSSIIAKGYLSSSSPISISVPSGQTITSSNVTVTGLKVYIK